MIRLGVKALAFAAFGLAATLGVSDARAQTVTAPFSWKGATWQFGQGPGTTYDTHVSNPPLGYLDVTTSPAYYGDVEIYTDSHIGAVAGASSWSASFSFIDNFNGDGTMPSIEMFLSSGGTPNTGNQRLNGGAAFPYQLDSVGHARWRLASDRATQINNFGGTPGAFSIPQSSQYNGFYFESKDNFATNIRSGGSVASPMGFVSTDDTMLAIDASGNQVGTGSRLLRQDGVEHTVTFGKLANGNLEVIFDGNLVYTETFGGANAKSWSSLSPPNDWPNWDLGRISLLVRGGTDGVTGTTITFTDFSVTATYPVPEPSGLGLLGVGAAAMLWRRRRAA